jgi:NADPH:quinone reductase-like Zn-dependent oxidoreductase
MKSLNIVFASKETVDTRLEPVPELLPGQILVESGTSLISTGTECICLQQKFVPNTHWHEWVKYPFYPGYNNIGRVLKLGEGVTSLRVGERVAVREQHRQYFITTPEWAVKIPDNVSERK